MSDIERPFLDTSIEILRGELAPRVVETLQRLSLEDVWWRPNEESNSIGNLCLHLAGNVRQWIVSGVGGAPDVRRRQEEFDERGRLSVEELASRLEGAVAEAVAVLAGVPDDALLKSLTVQGREVSVLYAVYHVVEHFSMHTGQILYVAKLRLGRDLGFYPLVDGLPRAHWSRPHD